MSRAVFHRRVNELLEAGYTLPEALTVTACQAAHNENVKETSE